VDLFGISACPHNCLECEFIGIGQLHCIKCADGYGPNTHHTSCQSQYLFSIFICHQL